MLVIYQAFPSLSAEPSAQTDSIGHREQVSPAHPVSWFSKRGSFSVFTVKLIRFLALVALSALTITAASHTAWTWCNIALVMTSVSLCVLPYHVANSSLAGLYNNTGYSQRLRNSPTSSHLFITFDHRVAIYACFVHLPRRMATDDLRHSPG